MASVPSLCIRAADPGEAERLREIAFAAKSHWGYDLEQVRQWALGLDFSPASLRKKELYVAEEGGHIVGWSAVIAQGDVCWLDDLWIEPNWMRRGIGTRLFEHAADRGRHLGAMRMEWEAERHALGFYDKMGARYLRDSKPGVWGRVSAIMGVDLEAASPD